MKNISTKLIWCLPFSGLLFLISLWLRGQVFDVSDTEHFIGFATDPNFQLGATLNVFNFILLFLGVVGLGLYTIEKSAEGVAVIAFVLLFIAHCLTFCYLGLLAFIYNKAATMAADTPTILEMFDLAKNTSILPVVLADSISYISGTLLTVYVLLKNRIFSLWISVLFGLSFFLVGVIPPATLSNNPDISRISELVGNTFIFISGYAMAKAANTLHSVFERSV
jgi:hypothetical protein